MTTTPHPHATSLLDTGQRERATHIAVSPHHLASGAAVDIMDRGGNAADAAVAADAVLSVVLPDTCGPGGDLFALIFDDGDEMPRALNASGRAGSGADAAALRSEGLTRIPANSRNTVTIPGCVDGWEALLEREGSMSMSEVLAPAIDLASDGFPVSLELSRSLEKNHSLLAGQESAPPLYPNGRPPAPGQLVRRPRLAATLSGVAEDGREAFYSGEVGAAISAVTSGAITAKDLEERQAEWVTPISIDVFDVTGWTVPPNSQGYLTLATVWLFENFVDSADPNDPDFQHGLIEAYRSVAWERDDLVADPGHARGETASLLDPERLGRRRAILSRDRASHWPPPRRGAGGTAFMCARDGSGKGVALIQSNYHGIGSGLSAGDTGVFLHDRGAGFNLIPGHANELRPGKRPLHTLSPSLWTHGGKLVGILGTRGGDYQPQILAQVAARLFRAGEGPATAIAAPRWGVDGWREPRQHRVLLEPGPQSSSMAEALSHKGHDVRVASAPMIGWGPVSLITVGESHVAGATDPRVGTAAALASL